MNEEILWFYTGNGLFIDGVPARDLTADDLVRMSRDELAAVAHSGLYQRAPQPAKQDEPEAEPFIRVTRKEAAEVDDGAIAELVEPEPPDELPAKAESGAKNWKRERGRKE